MKGLDEKLTVSKTYSINMLIRRFERGEVRRDNPFQRSPIWKQYQKDFLIFRIQDFFMSVNHACPQSKNNLKCRLLLIKQPAKP